MLESMPIHYDTIEGDQIKNSHLLFSVLVRIVLLAGFICQKYYNIISLVSLE